MFPFLMALRRQSAIVKQNSHVRLRDKTKDCCFVCSDRKLVLKSASQTLEQKGSLSDKATNFVRLFDLSPCLHA